MTLIEYIKSFPRREQKAVRRLLAKELGNISEVYVRSMCNGHKDIPAKFAIRIEQFTKGQVKRHITAPEYYPLEINQGK
jgi:DNA-binding transcriptional regulator YdaS (Cro superfamily)